MFSRNAGPELAELAKGYPIVTVLGPRQSGKTTLVRYIFPKKAYVNLEALDTQETAKLDPRGFLAQYPNGAILDEVQRVPELLSYVQVIVDETNIKGMFVLTGSHQMELHQAISQSLAGRTAILNLLPMSISELSKSRIELPLDEALLKGGYPRLFKENLDPTQLYRFYLQTYIERDLRQLIQIKDLIQFQRFVRICAGRIGQLLSLESIGNDVGISANTVRQWISILEASFIVFRLPPYYENFDKRITKSPKLYFHDVGLASYLLGIENVVQMKRDPLRGNLFENYIILELMKERLNKGLDPQLYYFRDAHGHKVDLIFQSGRQLVPIEIKAAQTFNSDFLKNLNFFQNLAGAKSGVGYVIYAGDQEQKIQSFKLLNYKNATEAITSPEEDIKAIDQ